MKTVRAFPYPGAKMGQVWDLTCFLPEHYQQVVEPFAGSASFSLHLLTHRFTNGGNCWLNDSNEQLMNFYRVMQSPMDCDQLVMKLLHIHREHEWVDRPLFNKCVDILNAFQASQIDRAVAYYLFMRASYLRIQRFEYNHYTPVVAEAIGIPKRRILDLLAVGKLLRNVRLTQLSYESVLAMVAQASFVFMDSPYTKSQHFYGRTAFDLDAYANTCKARKDKCKMMITLDDCEANRNRFAGSGFTILQRSIYYASTKRRAPELMMLNYRLPMLDYWAEMADYKIIHDGS